MKGLVRVFTLSTVALICLTQNVHAQSLQSCSDKAQILKKNFVCSLNQHSGQVTFTLTQGQSIQVLGQTRYGQINQVFQVRQVSALPPRLSGAGAMDESLLFSGQMGSYSVTMAIPCGDENYYAAVALGKTRDGNDPAEHVASCVAQ